MTSITRQYPNIVKWLKAARAAALKERGTFHIGTEEDYTYITDGIFALRIPAAQISDWQAVVNLAPIKEQMMNATLRETLSRILVPSSFDVILLDTSVLAHVKCQADEPLCRVYALQKAPYVIRENHAASLREIGGPAVVQEALGSGSTYPARVEASEGLAALALPIRLDRDPRLERILIAAANAAVD